MVNRSCEGTWKLSTCQPRSQCFSLLLYLLFFRDWNAVFQYHTIQCLLIFCSRYHRQPSVCFTEASRYFIILVYKLSPLKQFFFQKNLSEGKNLSIYLRCLLDNHQAESPSRPSAILHRFNSTRNSYLRNNDCPSRHKICLMPFGTWILIIRSSMIQY